MAAVPLASHCPYHIPGADQKDTKQSPQKCPALLWLLALSSQKCFVWNCLTSLGSRGGVTGSGSPWGFSSFQSRPFLIQFYILNLKTNNLADSHLPCDCAADCFIVCCLNQSQIKIEQILCTTEVLFLKCFESLSWKTGILTTLSSFSILSFENIKCVGAFFY